MAPSCDRALAQQQGTRDGVLRNDDIGSLSFAVIGCQTLFGGKLTSLVACAHVGRV
jgi:hypothetical protein